MKKYKFSDIKSITLSKSDLDFVKKVARDIRCSKESALSYIIHFYCYYEGFFNEI